MNTPEKIGTEPILLDLRAAAALLGLSPATLATWSWQRRIPTVRLGRKRMFKRDDLVAWVERHREPAVRSR